MSLLPTTAPHPRRILCVNLNYMGDALFTTPALATLKARFPDATLDVLVGARGAAILGGNPAIDRMVVRPRHGGAGRAIALAGTLRAGRYDAVVLFQSTLSNALLTFLAGVPIRVGFSQEGCAPLLTVVEPTRQRGEHDVDAYLRLANALGGAPAREDDATGRLSVALSGEERAFAGSFLRDHALDGPVVGLVIGATRPQKRWPEEHFARLAEKLWRASGIRCVLLGGPDEAEAADRIRALAGETPLLSAVAKTTEKELAALIGRLSVVVSGDSGPLHIATAMATPVVALFGSTDPADTGPWKPVGGGAPSTVLYDALSCAPCRKNPTCDGRFDCMRGLTPDRVFDAIRDLLGLPGGRRALPVLSPERPPARQTRRIAGLKRPVRSVLILTKHRFMGDTIVAVPLLRAVREIFPESRITLLTGSEAATALQNCPYDISLLPNDPRTKARTPAGSARLSASLIRRMARLFLRSRPDLCLVADRSFRAALAARLCGGRVRAGFDTEGRGCLLTHPVPYDSRRHETECCLDILRAVAPELPGEPPYDPTPVLWLTAAERERGAQILHTAGANGPLRIGIQPGASLGDRKQWPPERYAAVARTLADRRANIVLLGYGAAEADAARQMCEALSDIPVVDLTGKTSLRETMGVVSQLSLFIGNDTGVNHIAAALGIPTVALFGPTPARKWGSVGPDHAVIEAPDGDIESIPVESVRSAAMNLLFGQDPSAAARATATGIGIRR
jgi:heptosyltransferase-1